MFHDKFVRIGEADRGERSEHVIEDAAFLADFPDDRFRAGNLFGDIRMILSERCYLVPVRRFLDLGIERIREISVAHDFEEVEICLAVVFQVRVDARLAFFLLAGEMEPHPDRNVIYRKFVHRIEHSCSFIHVAILPTEMFLILFYLFI